MSSIKPDPSGGDAGTVDDAGLLCPAAQGRNAGAEE